MERGNLAMSFMIPDVSLLLIYKDNWNKSNVMRKVIAEMLRNGFYKEIYTGNKVEFQCSQHLLGLEDCAIVSLKLSGSQYLNYEEKEESAVFANELENPRNILHFDNSVLSEINQVSFIEMAIRITKPEEKAEAETQAA